MSDRNGLLLGIDVGGTKIAGIAVDAHSGELVAERRQPIDDVPLERQVIGFARGLVEDGALLGWIGGLPEYDGRVWELHPIVVRPDRRRRGLGRSLVMAFEAEAGARGAFTVTLGTDDDSGMTSLADVDLFADIPRHIAELKDLGRGHPFLFYRKLGFAVTGVMPDANGPGRPDIYMSKPVRRD